MFRILFDGEDSQKRDLFGSGLCLGLNWWGLPVKLKNQRVVKQRLSFRVVQHFTVLNVSLFHAACVLFTSCNLLFSLTKVQFAGGGVNGGGG